MNINSSLNLFSKEHFNVGPRRQKSLSIVRILKTLLGVLFLSGIRIADSFNE
jgi:hypothetical protein